MPKSIYRPRGSNPVRQCVTLNQSTVDGLEKIKAAFYSRFPKDQYDPTFSAIFETVLQKAAAELDADPDWLAVEVADFQRRYLQARR